MINLPSVSIGRSKELFALQGFPLHAGEILCVLGINGSGKSTLLESLAGFIPCHTGKLDLAKNKRLAFIGSRSQNHPQLRVKQAILLAFNRDKPWYKAYNEAQNNACHQMLMAYGLNQYADAFVNELSDGQQQKLWIAQALLSQPDVMILDEPTGNLDADNTAFILKNIKDWVKKEQKYVVLSSHKIDWMLQIADAFFLIKDGESKYFRAHDKHLIEDLNHCFSGKYHSVDFQNHLYHLR